MMAKIKSFLVYWLLTKTTGTWIGAPKQPKRKQK